MQSPTASTETIPLKHGVDMIMNNGVTPYLERLENRVSDLEYDRTKIKASQYMDAYNTIFKMCIQREPDNWSANLYELYSDVIRNFLVKNVVQALKAQQAMHVIAFLKEWNVAWTTQSRLVHGMQSMFMYLDRFYVPNNEQLPLYKKGYTICKELILEEFKKFVVDAILSCVAKERAGETQDRDLLAKAIRAFVDLGYHLELGVTLYQENFEVAFIQQTKLFYKQQAQIWLEQDSCPDYLKKAEAAIDDEENRLNMYLHSSSLNVLMSTCRDELLKFHQPELLAKQTGIYDMLSRNAVDDLSRIYKLYQHVEEGIKPIAEALKEHVKKLGSGLIEQSKNKAKSKDASASDKGGVEQHEFIESLIELHETYRNIVKNCFTKDQVFEKALKEAFEDFINKEFYTSNLLAKFINDVLTKDSKVHAQDIENTLDHVVMLYGYIRQKDVFEERYHTYLANRLLTRKSESEHSEKNMISKLKNEAGYQWTSKLETMFKDVVKSQELMEEFSRSHKSSFNEELSVIVCTSGCWPSASAPSMTVPQELTPICDKFKEFYLNKFAGTKLSWALYQGEAEALVQFSVSTARVLVVTTYQMMILLLFNQKRILKFSEIAEITQIPKKDLVSHIISLAHPKIKVLLKKPNVKEVLDDDEFALNSKFTSKAYRVVIPLIQVRSAADDANSEKVSGMVMIQRRHQIDAAIVRVMKTRLRLEHNQLITEVVKQLQRFKPDAGDIKKRIEALIEQEYLERDEKERKIYNYLA